MNDDNQFAMHYIGDDEETATNTKYRKPYQGDCIKV